MAVKYYEMSETIRRNYDQMIIMTHNQKTAIAGDYGKLSTFWAYVHPHLEHLDKGTITELITDARPSTAWQALSWLFPR